MNSSKNQFVKNTTMNIVGLFCNIGIGILLVPYLVNRLGVAAYGLIPLSMLLIEYIGIISQSFASAINRYLSLAIKNENSDSIKEQNIIFNTALFGMFALCIIQFIIFIYPIANINKIINIGDLFVKDSVLLFLYVFLSYLLSLITSIFNVSLYASNRLDLMQLATILRVLTRTGFILILFSFDMINLENVGLATFLSSSICLIFSIYWHYKLTPLMKISYKYFRKEKIGILSSLSGWLLVNQIGFILLSRFDIFIVNKLIGEHEAGSYAIVVQLSNLIRSALGVFSGLLGPIVISLYVKGDIEKLKSYIYIFVKFLTMISIIPISLIIYNSSIILNIWLGGDYDYLSTLVIILILPLFLNIGVVPLFSINTAYNKVKLPGIVSLVFGFIYLFTSYILVKYYGFGMNSIAISSILALSLKNAFFTPIYAAYILNENWYKYLKIQIIGSFYLIICFFCIKGVNSVIDIDNIQSLMGNFIVASFIMLPFGIVFFNKKEILLIYNNIIKR